MAVPWGAGRRPLLQQPPPHVYFKHTLPVNGNATCLGVTQHNKTVHLAAGNRLARANKPPLNPCAPHSPPITTRRPTLLVYNALFSLSICPLKVPVAAGALGKLGSAVLGLPKRALFKRTAIWKHAVLVAPLQTPPENRSSLHFL